MHPAERLFREEWNDKKHIVHNKAVLRACLKAKNISLDEDVFIISSWLHDMGKLKNKEKHHLYSIYYLDKFMEENPEYKGLYTEIKDCIINHRSGLKPKTKYGKIFQAADKEALLDKKWLLFKKKK